MDIDDELSAVVSGLNMLGEELKNFQWQAKNHHDFLQNIMGSIDEVVYARDLDYHNVPFGKFTFVSDRCSEIIGHGSNMLLESPELWYKAIHSQDQEHYIRGMHKLLQGMDVVLLYRLALPGKKGYRWIEDRIVAQPDADGQVIHTFGSARDVTEQQESKLELEAKNEFISRMIASSDQFFYIVALCQHDTFANNFTYLSWQIEKIQGSKVEVLKNNPRSWIELIHPDDLEGLIADNKVMFSTGMPVTRIYRVRHAITNEYVWLEDYVIPVADQSGKIIELYGSARDISARKEAKLKLETLNAELNLRYKELMQFSYIVSHNLRSPVANIMALAKLLNDGMPEQEAGLVTNYMLEEARQMDVQLHDLNVIISTKSDFNIKKELVEFSDVISSVQHALSEEIGNSDASFNVEIGVDAQEIFSIKSYLHSIFFNLISNSIKYYLGDGRPIIEIGIYRDQQNTVIRVADNGPGIDLEANGESLFALYGRFKQTKNGTGLGWYTTKTQVETLGGKISVESVLGRGTTFTILL